MVGITQGRKDFDHNQLVICTQCGQYGRYRVFMTFTQLLLFFIPCFRWGKRYFVQMSCCGAVYELDPEIGARISRGEEVQIKESELKLSGGFGGGHARMEHYMEHRCPACGYRTAEDFTYCPKCGGRLE